MACLQPPSGNNAALFIVPEVECNVLPTNPAWIPIRFTAGAPTLQKDSQTIKELNGKRDITGFVLGHENSAAEISVVLSADSHDDLIEAVLQDTWTSAGATIPSLSLTVDADLQTITRASGSFINDGVKVGQLIRFPSLTGNNANALYVTGVIAAVVSVSAMNLQDETGTSSMKLPEQLRVGTSRRTFSLMSVLDLGATKEYHIITGVEFTSYSGSLALNAPVDMSFTAMGRTYLEPTNVEPAGSTYLTATSTEPFTDLDGRIVRDDGQMALVTGVEFGMESNANAGYEIGTKGMAYIDYGEANNTLSLETVYSNFDDFKAFRAEETASINVILERDGKALSWSWPTSYYSSAGAVVDSPSVITQSLAMQPIIDAVEGTSLIVQRV